METIRIPALQTPDAAPSLHDLLDMQVRAYNAEPGDLPDYDCAICRNKGYVARHKDGEFIKAECTCLPLREKHSSTLRNIQESGLQKQLREKKFSNFEDGNPWQKAMKQAAIGYTQSDAAGFFLGGQSGCGKTHLCTAIIGQMIKRGLSARYFVWREDAPALKALITDAEYTARMQAYKQTDCLYIDDLFKGGASDADIRLAFELIDYRTRNALRTIISTELLEEELIRTDEALAGRIFDLAEGFRMVIPKDPKKNYRLRRRT